MSERYAVSKVTGYSISPDGYTGHTKPVTVWYVLDRAYCHCIVQEFKGRANRRLTTEEAAREYAATLNADDGRPA